MFAPGSTGSGASDTATVRSASGVTLTVFDAELFAAFGSFVVDVTANVPDSIPPRVGTTLICAAAFAPLASVASVQVTSCPTAPHVQPLPPPAPNDTPAGIV